jgi:hypothetical protein
VLRKSALSDLAFIKVAHLAARIVVALAGLGIVLTAGATDPAYVLSGRVTDDSGIEPVAGAVVSLELGLVPDGSATRNEKLPTKLAVWQAQTGADGTFSLPAQAEALTLPPGTKLSETRLQVFALAYAPHMSSDVKLNTRLMAQRQVRILPSQSEMNIRLILEPQDDPWITAQLDAMYNAVRQGTHVDVGLGGQQQAVASYGPLLNLLAMSCFQIEALSGRSPVPCQKANKEFDLRRAFPAEVSFIQREPEAPRPQAKPATPMVIKGSPPVSPSQGGIQQQPPDN